MCVGCCLYRVCTVVFLYSFRPLLSTFSVPFGTNLAGRISTDGRESCHKKLQSSQVNLVLTNTFYV